MSSVSKTIKTISFLPSGYLQCIDSATAFLVEKYSLQIQTLSYSQAIHPVTGSERAIPEGCAVAIASDKCTVHLMLKVRVHHSQHDKLVLMSWRHSTSPASVTCQRRSLSQWPEYDFMRIIIIHFFLCVLHSLATRSDEKNKGVKWIVDSSGMVFRGARYVLFPTSRPERATLTVWWRRETTKCFKCQV